MSLACPWLFPRSRNKSFVVFQVAFTWWWIPYLYSLLAFDIICSFIKEYFLAILRLKDGMVTYIFLLITDVWCISISFLFNSANTVVRWCSWLLTHSLCNASLNVWLPYIWWLGVISIVNKFVGSELLRGLYAVQNNQPSTSRLSSYPFLPSLQDKMKSISKKPFQETKMACRQIWSWLLEQAS